MGAEEGILYAECDLETGVLTKLRHDFAGHYNRPDIFQLQVNRAAPRIYTVHTTEEQLAPPADPAAAAGPRPLPRTAGRRALARPAPARRARARRKRGDRK